MDWSISALVILREAREICRDRLELYMSGGIRRGTDILKALALGADGVLSGRAVLYGLCPAGSEGVANALSIPKSGVANGLEPPRFPSLDALDSTLLSKPNAPTPPIHHPPCPSCHHQP